MPFDSNAGSSTWAYAVGTIPHAGGSESLSTFLYQHSDHLTTRLTTDNSGQVSNQQAHYPYGESWYAGGGADWSVARKFTSYLKDGETGAGQVHYAVFRQHGARIGRFHMADPVRGNIRNPQRLNRYSYVLSDPANSIDPRGLDGSAVDGIIGISYNPGSLWLGGAFGPAAAGWSSWGNPDWVYGIGHPGGGPQPTGPGGGPSGSGGCAGPACDDYEEDTRCEDARDTCIQSALSGKQNCLAEVERHLENCRIGCVAACPLTGYIYTYCLWNCNSGCSTGARIREAGCHTAYILRGYECHVRYNACVALRKLFPPGFPGP